MYFNKVNKEFEFCISSGTEFLWTCWPYARYIDYETVYGHASVVVNTKTGEVYQATITMSDHHSSKTRIVGPYRWLNPKYGDDLLCESLRKNIHYNIAWDKVKWIDIVDENRFIKYAKHILFGVAPKQEVIDILSKQS